MSAIEIKNLSKSFGSFKAVSNLNFSVEENRVIGFLGPNGAGKTTTIRMIAGLSKPTSGEISIAGQKVVFGQTPPKNFGYLPEQPSFYSWMTGYEYLDFVASIFNLPRKEKIDKINQLLKLVDLTAAKNKRIGSYSNGMRQRLGIAQALINNPAVLIMDEPVSALDPLGRREVLAVIEKLKEKMTILMSTHILADVDRICDDVIIINHGKLIAFSSLPELKEKYAKPILEVEFSSDPESIVADLKNENWIARYEKSGNTLRLWIKQTDIFSTNEPMKFFVSKNIGILKYGLIVPEIEDLFVELVEGKK